MKKVFAASIGSALCLLSLVSGQLPSFAEELPTTETQTETLETPAVDNTLTAPAPDLIIKRVKEKGNRAKVLIRNVGSKASKPCILRVYGGAALNVTGGAKIPAIPAGGSRVVNVSGAAQSPSLYFVDATNLVAELNEANNVNLVP